MTGICSLRPGHRYWLTVVLLPFAAVFLAMSGYAVLHGYLGVPEARTAEGLFPVLLEAAGWLVAVPALEGTMLLFLYRLDVRSALVGMAVTVSCSGGRLPALLAGLAGFFLALILGRALVAEALFSGSALAAFVVLAGLQAPLVAPLADLGEAKLLEERSDRR